MAKIMTFFRECGAELRKVVWPGRADVISSVKVVLVSILVVALVLGALDLGFTAAFRAIMK
ncbi:MAG: preprotein translocase subunit SecE [Treponema sp.]|jgi:preprotein translocase subunit SecE|nr:preprotein translocase subunit SecE [Treponema sp.]